MTILLTGFEPFAGRDVNLSWEVAKRIAVLPEFTESVKAARLPVSFDKAPRAIEDAMKQYNPDIVLMLGFSAKREDINVERIAINIKDARMADNDGCRPMDEPIKADGLVGIFSTLPVKQILTAIQETGIDAKISNSAGTYVCNTAFYSALDYARKSEKRPRVGFVHLPDIDIDQAVKAITAVLRHLIKSCGE